MRKILKWTKEIEGVEREIEILRKKLDLEKKRQEVGEITKADLVKFRSRIDTKERDLRAKIHRLQKLRVTRERKLKEQEEERKKRLEDKKKE